MYSKMHVLTYCIYIYRPMHVCIHIPAHQLAYDAATGATPALLCRPIHVCTHILYIHIQTHAYTHTNICTSVGSKCSNGCHTSTPIQTYSIYGYTCTDVCMYVYTYWVAMISRLLKIISLFFKRA